VPDDLIDADTDPLQLGERARLESRTDDMDAVPRGDGADQLVLVGCRAAFAQRGVMAADPHDVHAKAFTCSGAAIAAGSR
jgi:hypothetical protein